MLSCGMIDRVDILPFEDSPGVLITFHYDTACQDTFTVWDGAQVEEIWAMIQSGVQPENVLVAIRHFGKFTLH